MIRRTLNAGRIGHSPLASRSRGFSLVELMMSIVLMAIGLALALPSYRDMVEKRQVTNGAEQVAAFLNTAQGMAMKTNKFVMVSYSRTADNEWCIGAVEVDDPDDEANEKCDCTVSDPETADCKIKGELFILNNAHASDREFVHSVTGDGAYTFDPIRGLFSNLDDSLSMELRSPSDDFRLNVMVNNTGRVTLCSESAEHAIPGYELCPAAMVEEELSGS